MIDGNKSIENDLDRGAIRNDRINKAKVSACGCNTDHHNGQHISTVYKNKRIYFCVESCKEEFLDDPELFLASDHFMLQFKLLEDE